MLNIIFRLMSIINGVIFLLSFFTILKKLEYKNNNNYSLLQRVINLSLNILVIINVSRATLYSSLGNLIISIILLSIICGIRYKINWNKSILYCSIYSFLYNIINQLIYYIMLYTYIILIENGIWTYGMRIEFFEFIIFNLCVLLFTQNFNRVKKIYENSKYYIYILLAILINSMIVAFLYMSTSNIYEFYSLLTENKIYYDSGILNMPFINFASSTLPYIVVGINIVFISLLINAIRTAKEESKIKVMNEKLDLQYNYYLTVKES